MAPDAAKPYLPKIQGGRCIRGLSHPPLSHESDHLDIKSSNANGIEATNWTKVGIASSNDRKSPDRKHQPAKFFAVDKPPWPRKLKILLHHTGWGWASNNFANHTAE